jgi:formylglycine-generating enzyme required for sulfatase activity/predicted small secreted protein
MKTNKLYLIVVLVLAIALAACNGTSSIQGSGNIVTEERDVSGFDRVTFSGLGHVNIQQGDQELLTISADDNILPYIQTEVSGGILTIGIESGGQDRGFDPSDGIEFNLVVKELTRLDIYGTGNINVGELQTEKLLVDNGGVGDLEITLLTADELVVRHSGAGAVIISGQVKGQELSHNGVGSYFAIDLRSQTASIKISGAGSADVWAVETLDVEIAGLGNLTFYGSPRIIQNISGGGKLISTLLTDDHGATMALVPAGPFEMGSINGDDDEQPVHTVTLDAFYMDQYEVTNSQYAVCVELGVCDPVTDTTAFDSSYSRRIYYGNPAYADYPVIYASWHEAQQYCEWRGGARLPTEAEWEKAARGGLEGKTYPWGDQSPVCEVGAVNGAKFDDDGDCNDTDTEQVGRYSANGYGLYDMVGNVWEWVSDFYDENYYADSAINNPSGPEDGGSPVIRGGTWGNNAEHLRVSDRRYHDSISGSLYSGFRCARDVSP